jgi:uroporphyrinogen-III synthase
MRLLVTRPSEDSADLTQRLTTMGHDVVPAPLLEIHFIAGDELDLRGVQAVLFTSANGVRSFVRRSSARAHMAMCVGDATAREARLAGFRDVKSATGDVGALAALVKVLLDPEEGALVHPAGSRVAGDLAGLLEAGGFTYRREVLYDATKAETLPEAARAALAGAQVDGVLLYSPRTGAAFARLVAEAGLADRLGGVTVYCLSEAVAGKVQSLDWAAVKIAHRPDQESLLALLT